MSPEPSGTLARLRRLARTPVPMPRFRRAHRRPDAKRLVAEAQLPQVLCATVLDIVKRTRLWRSENADVADELIAHFSDGLAAGRSAQTLVSDFGSPELAARLIRRAKRRQRPLAWRAWVRSLQGVGLLFGVVVVIYLFAAVRLYTGTPRITHDYLADVNAVATSVPPDERAWPVYRAALLSFGDLRDLPWSTDPRPGDAEWPQFSAKLAAHAEAFALAREAAARPGMGYVAGYKIDEADAVLWPDLITSGPHNPQGGLLGVLLPHLRELRKLTRLLALDAYRAAATGDGATVSADLEAGLRMAGHSRELPMLLSDMLSLAQTTLVLNTLGEILAYYPQIFTDDQLHRLAHQLAALDRGRLVARLDGEKMLFHDTMQHMYTDDGDGDGHLTAEGLRWLTTATAVKPPQPPTTRVGPLAPAAALLMAGRREMTDEYERWFARAEAEHAKPLWEQDPMVVNREIGQMQLSLIQTTRYFPLILLMPSLGKAGRMGPIVAQQRDAMLVAIALELYRRRRGVWPASLDPLVPELLPAVGPDRFDGQPLRYRLLDGKPLVYAIGWDRNDDRGRPPRNQRGRPEPRLARNTQADGDWILWPPWRDDREE